MENKVLISRESLAKRWDISVQTIVRYENEGIITRVPGIPSPRYNINEVLKIEGDEINPLSPLERRRLERKITELEHENESINVKLNNAKIALGI